MLGHYIHIANAERFGLSDLDLYFFILLLFNRYLDFFFLEVILLELKERVHTSSDDLSYILAYLSIRRKEEQLVRERGSALAHLAEQNKLLHEFFRYFSALQQHLRQHIT